MSEPGENAPPPPPPEDVAAPAPASGPSLDAPALSAPQPLPSEAAPEVVEVAPPAAPPPPRVPLEQRVREQLQQMDQAFARLAIAARTWAVLPLILAVCIGEAAWATLHLAELHKIDTNKLPEAERITAGICVAASLLGLLFVFLVAAIVRSRGGRGFHFAETAAIVGERLIPLAALPVIPTLALANIEKDSPKLALFYIVLAAIVVGRGAYAWGRGVNDPMKRPLDAPDRMAEARWPAGVAAGCVAALGVAYGAFFSRLAITNHHALNSRTTDLGYYDNIFYQSIHGNPLGCSFIRAGYHGSAHFDPLLILLSPIYLLYPRAEFILTLQSVWLASGVIPVYLIAKLKLGRRAPAVALAAMYVLFPAMQGANMYEFHSLTLVTPVMLWLLYLLERRAFAAYWPVFAVALLVREDISLLLCFVGLYALLADRARLARVGWLTIGISLCYFVLVKRVFMTSADIFMSGKDAYSFAYYYDDLIPNHTGVGGLLLSLVTNPMFVVKTVFAEPKVLYLLQIFVPLMFLPFLARTGRTMLIYGLAFTTLASRTAVFSIHFQYSNLLVPILFTLTPMALRRLEDGQAQVFGLDGKRIARAALTGAFVASVLVSWKFGGYVENQSFKGGFSRVARKLTDQQKATYAWLDEATKKIPKDASVAASSKMGPHISNRMEAYFYPEHTNVDYVLIDEGELKAHDLAKHNAAVHAGQLVQVTRKDRLVLFSRNVDKPPPPASSAVPRPPEGEHEP